VRTWIPLEYFSQCIIVDDILFLSAEKSKVPLGIARSSFASDADWRAARLRIEAFVTPRKIEDIKIPR